MHRLWRSDPLTAYGQIGRRQTDLVRGMVVEQEVPIPTTLVQACADCWGIVAHRVAELTVLEIEL